MNTYLIQEEEVMREICKLRHELHVLDCRAEFYNEGNMIDIVSRLEDILPQEITTYLPNAIDLPCCEDDDIEDVEDSIQEIHQAVELANTKIEEYLRVYDEEHGTEYAPTGMARARWIASI